MLISVLIVLGGVIAAIASLVFIAMAVSAFIALIFLKVPTKVLVKVLFINTKGKIIKQVEPNFKGDFTKFFKDLMPAMFIIGLCFSVVRIISFFFEPRTEYSLHFAIIAFITAVVLFFIVIAGSNEIQTNEKK